MIYTNFYINTIDQLNDSIKEIEFICRHSKCYKAIIANLEGTLQLVYSVSFPNINFADNDVDLEVHHILTLYSICQMVGIKMLIEKQDDEYITVYDIAKEVMRLHSEDMLPLIVFSTTEHQLYHSGNFTFDSTHPCLHLAKTQQFVDVYHEYLTEQERELLISLGIKFDYAKEEEHTS